MEINQEVKETYDSRTMPGTSDPELISIAQKIAKGEELTIGEKIKLPGHDHPVKMIGDYECKPNCCYRAVSLKVYEMYKQTGLIQDLRPNAKDNIIELDENGKYYTSNSGIDWYLGGVGLRYGDVVIECPALKQYFEPAIDNGTRLSADPTVRHMKSSPKRNPIPTSIITNVFDLNKIKQKNLQEFEKQRQVDMQKRIEQFKDYLPEKFDKMVEPEYQSENDVRGIHR